MAKRGGPPPPHQQRLEAAVAWSYELLTLGEQRLFRSFAVFAAGWTLGDAEAVCANGPQRTRLVDLLARLVEKSLVLAEDGPNGERWYRQLETIRQFAAERLRTSGEDGAIRERHLQHYMRLAEQADHTIRWTAGLPWSTRQGWLTRMAWEYPNMRAAYR